MRRAANHLLSAWLIACLIAGPVRAAPTLLPRPDFYAGRGGTKLLVVVAPADARAKSLAGLVEQAAEAAADGSDRFAAVRGIDAFDATAAAARVTKEAEARALATEAQRALDDLDSAKASKLFADSVAAWMQADLSRSIDGLVEAQIGKAAGHATSEENPQAKAELDKALLLAPKAKLSDAHFTPELLKYADGQRAKLAKAKGKLTVRTEPPGARVWVDGLYRGASPVTAEGLGSGPHLVTAGLAGWSLTTDALPPGEQLLRLKPAEGAAQLQAAVDRIVQEPEGAGRDAAARELAQAARADQVLVLVVKKGQSADQLEIAAARLDAIDGHVYASRSGTAGVPTELRGITEWVGALLGADEPRGAGGTASSASKAKGKGGGMSGLRIAGIGLLGGAVAAGASWAIFGLSALGRVNQYKGTFQVETMKSNQAVRDGRTFALVADISWAVGAAFLVAGLLLVVLGGGSSSSGGSRGSGPAAKPAEDDAMREYRRHQEEQKRAEEERQKKAAEPPPAEEQKPEEQKPPEEKKPEEAKPPPPEEKKKLTPEEEKAEKKKKAEDEKAEKKRLAEEAKKKAEDEKAEKKRLAEEAKKKAEEEKAEKKRAAEEAKKKAEEEKAEKKRAAEEAKKKAEEEKAEKRRAAEDEKKKAEEDQKRAEEDKKKAAEEDEKRKKDEEQRKADEEARRMDEERKKKEDEARQRDEDRKRDDRPPEKKKSDLEEDLRDDN